MSSSPNSGLDLSMLVAPAKTFGGRPAIPGDKSISHRALILGALAKGTTRISGLLVSDDVRSTMKCLQQLGVRIWQEGELTCVQGSCIQESCIQGSAAFVQPDHALDCGNSGTTMRLLMGVLAGWGEGSGPHAPLKLVGDSSLSKRPMQRVAEPLRRMGATIELSQQRYAPVQIVPGPLEGVTYELPVASAQVKSAVLLAALSAQGVTTLTGRLDSRDHTERMLGLFGAQIQVTPECIRLEGGQRLQGCTVKVPGDPSTAAFWLAAAAMIPGAHLELENISLNPTRLGFMRALRRMGAEIDQTETDQADEPVGRLKIRYSSVPLRGIVLEPSEIPSLIDEIPLIAVVATQAQGWTEVTGAEDLRVKECDRLAAIEQGIQAMGGEIEMRPDGFLIRGPQVLRGAHIETFGDHRIAMAFSVAALVAQGVCTIHQSESVSVSYPKFFETLSLLSSEKTQ